MSVTETQLLLARLRAEGSLPAGALVGNDAAAHAATVGRRIVRLDDRVCLAWQDDFEPASGGAATATVSDFAALVLAVLLGLCWRDLSEEPWPGEPLGPGTVDRIAGILNRDRRVVLKFVAELRAVGLVQDTGTEACGWGHRSRHGRRERWRNFAGSTID